MATGSQRSARGLLSQYLITSAVVGTGMVAAVTISAIAAERMLGNPTWSGLPMASSILGTALGSQVIGRLLERHRQRLVLAGHYAVAATGGLLAVLAVSQELFLLLPVGLAMLGFGHGATQYARYLAADQFEPSRRACVLSWVVWMTGLGAVFGPALLAPTGEAADRIGLAQEAGPYLAAVAAFALGALGYGLLLPKGLVTDRGLLENGRGTPVRFPPAARLAVLAMVVGHVVMVFVMTMTPIHLTHHGHGLGQVGVVLSAHMAGMFMLAPAIGALCARVGGGPVLIAGSALLVIACVLSVAAAGGLGSMTVSMSLPLFLLGLGWNFGFVGGSDLLSRLLPPEMRLRGRATADAMVWTAAASSSLLSSLLFAQIGFVHLSWLGAGLAAVVGGVLVARRRLLI